MNPPYWQYRKAMEMCILSGVGNKVMPVNEGGERMATELERLTREIKGLVIDRLKLDVEPDEIDDDELLFDGSLDLDSITMLELVDAIESRYGLEVDDEDLTPELVETARSLAEYVMGKAQEGDATRERAA